LRTNRTDGEAVRRLRLVRYLNKSIRRRITTLPSAAGEIDFCCILYAAANCGHTEKMYLE
jgi:hypothetical protein